MEDTTASNHPELDKMAAIRDQTQVIGEFLEWLTSQGINLMAWREDLTDIRPTDPECLERKRDRLHAVSPEPSLPCDPSPGDVIRSEYRWTAHCMHWQDPRRAADGEARRGTCCHCGYGQDYEVTGIRAWVHDNRSIEELLAAWAGIDLRKIEQERRAILAALPGRNGGH